MSREIRSLIDPAHTALLTMEMQNGVVGDDVTLPALRDHVRATGVLNNVSRLCSAARASGVKVVHNLALVRADGAGWAMNCRIFGLSQKQKNESGHYATEIGTSGADLIPEMNLHESDIVVERIHGMTAFTSTPLDQILRNMGIRTIICTGVSVNLGIMGMALNGVDLGYQVVVPRDAVAGVPDEYAQLALDNSIAMLATLTTADDVIAAWKK